MTAMAVALVLCCAMACVAVVVCVKARIAALNDASAAMAAVVDLRSRLDAQHADIESLTRDVMGVRESMARKEVFR